MKLKNAAIEVLATVVVCLFVSQFLVGQVYYSTVVGTVRDASGAVVPNAQVLATELSTNVKFQTHTNERGDYSIKNLRPGSYSVEVVSTGFQSKKITEVTLVVGQATRVDVRLDVGTSQQTVTVSGAAPLIQTESGQRGGLMQGTEVEALPLLGRNFMDLTLEFPGAVTSESSNMGPDSEPGVRVNGHSEFGNTVLEDGGFVMGQLQMTPVEFINIDAIQEMRVETANYSAQNGGHSGAVILIATKHGTNSFHGDLFEFFQNDKLNAANFFATSLPKAPVRYNLFGGTIGGPIRKDKLFFFGSYQGVRNRSPQTFLSEVPTVAERNGDFSADPPIYDPFVTDPSGNRVQFPGNVIPRELWSPVAIKYLPFWPQPNLQGTPNFTYNAASLNNYNLYEGRIDWNASSKDALFGRFSHQANPILTPGSIPGPGSFYQGNTKGGANMVIGWTHILSAKKFNNFHFSFANAYRTNIQGGFSSANEASTLGFAFADDLTGLSEGCPEIAMAGFGSTQIAPLCPADDNVVEPNRTYYVTDDFTFIHGAHTFQTGGLWMQYRDNSNTGRPGGGIFSFSGLYTAATGDTSGKTGYPFADFLLGAQNSLSYSQGFFKTNDRKNLFQVYFQDNWKTTANLSLNLGLRYEMNLPEYSYDGTLPAWIGGLGSVGFPEQRTGQVYVFPANARSQVTEALAGQSLGIPYTFSNTNALAYSHWRNIAPRVGFAYRLFGSTRTVIRGGYGIFYDYENFNGLQPGDARPFLGANSTLPQTVPPENQAPPYFLGQSPGPPIKYFTPGTLLPFGEQGDPNSEEDDREQEWNLTFQRGFGRDWSLEVGYVGNWADHLMIDQYANRFYPVGFTFHYTNGTSFTIQNDTPLLDRVPWPQVQQGFVQTPYGKGDYEAVQFSLVKRMSHGLEMRAGYTRQRALAVGDEGFRSNFSYVMQSEFDQTFEPSSADIPNVFYTTFVWQLPGQHLQGILGGVLGGWQGSGSIQIQSGQRSSLQELYPQWEGAAFVSPLVVCNPNNGAPHTLQEWFNTSCVQQPGPNQFGSDSAVNAIVNDPVRNVDLSLVKYFKTFENQRLQFRAEFFNAFNRPLFGAPDGTRGDLGFGEVTYAGPPRAIQLALKYEF